MCSFSLQAGHSGDLIYVGFILFKYFLRKDDFPDLSYVSILRVLRGKLISSLLILGAILFKTEFGVMFSKNLFKNCFSISFLFYLYFCVVVFCGTSI